MTVKFGDLKVGTCFKYNKDYCVKLGNGKTLKNSYWFNGNSFVHFENYNKVILLPFRFKV